MTKMARDPSQMKTGFTTGKGQTKPRDREAQSGDRAEHQERGQRGASSAVELQGDRLANGNEGCTLHFGETSESLYLL